MRRRTRKAHLAAERQHFRKNAMRHRGAGLRRRTREERRALLNALRALVLVILCVALAVGVSWWVGPEDKLPGETVGETQAAFEAARTYEKAMEHYRDTAVARSMAECTYEEVILQWTSCP